MNTAGVRRAGVAGAAASDPSGKTGRRRSRSGRPSPDRCTTAPTSLCPRGVSSEGICAFRPDSPPVPEQFTGPPLRDRAFCGPGQLALRPLRVPPAGPRSSFGLWDGPPAPRRDISYASPCPSAGVVGADRPSAPIVHRGQGPHRGRVDVRADRRATDGYWLSWRRASSSSTRLPSCSPVSRCLRVAAHSLLRGSLSLVSQLQPLLELLLR